jgi:hypothetical protein
MLVNSRRDIRLVACGHQGGRNRRHASLGKGLQPNINENRYSLVNMFKAGGGAGLYVDWVGFMWAGSMRKKENLLNGTYTVRSVSVRS